MSDTLNRYVFIEDQLGCILGYVIRYDKYNAIVTLQALALKSIHNNEWKSISKPGIFHIRLTSKTKNVEFYNEYEEFVAKYFAILL